MGRIVRIVLTVLLLEILGVVLIQKEEVLAPVLETIPTVIAEESEIKNESEMVQEEEKITKKIILTPTPDNETWGVAKQVGEHTWTMKIGEDATMATAKEILVALNEYRQVHGSQILNWDEKLGNYAKDRAKFLNGIKSVDQHKGFNDFVENQNGFDKLGFTALGENISYGFKLNGVHVIEWMYAGDKPHNDNQLDNRWNYVGIGVDGLATCLIFGTGKF
ncbi:MAG: CAP domain-containing protein [Candidatus Shapirobacteria bacterium]|nr:CAP domain-containing protein [Candidatus Shapirobacteria bacterium]MDD4382927.1 CAP domain-containing protein [Candidatus Shapirobacteria bacterium]